MTRRSFSGVKLEHVAGFEVEGAEGLSVVTAEDIATDATELSNVSPMNFLHSIEPAELQGLVSDEFVLRNLVLRLLTIRIQGDTYLDLPPVTFTTTLQHNLVTRADTHGEAASDSMWYSPDLPLETFSARFVPTEGVVAGVSYLADRRLSSWGLGMFSTTPEATSLVLHNSLYVEIFHTPQEEELPPLPPPHEMIHR